MSPVEGQLAAPDGLRLRTQTWPAAGPPRAVVVITHGHGEHCGRYAHVAPVLNARGYKVCLYDLRGHGRSEGPRGHVRRFALYLDDLQTVHDWVRRENPGQKIFAHGHSMGACALLHWVLRDRPELAGVTATAPWLQLAFRPPAWKLLAARLLARAWPSLTLKTGLTPGVYLSHDAALLNSFPDRALSHPRISAGAYRAIQEAAASALAQAPAFTHPLLIMHGEQDKVISLEGSRDFLARAGSVDKTLLTYPGLWHEVQNETERAQVFRDWLAWLDART